MSFVNELVQESLPIWEACLNSEFLTKLETAPWTKPASRATSWKTACICGSTPRCSPGA